MARLLKKRSKKAGLPPGSLIHIGEPKTEKVKLTIYRFNEAHLEEKEVESVSDGVAFCKSLKDFSFVTWINVDGLHDVELIHQLGEAFGVHPLIQEDILNTDQRPKLEDFGEYLYLVLKMLSYQKEKNHRIFIEQVSFILKPGLVISFQEEKKQDVFEPVRDRIRNSKGLIRKMGSDYLMYSLMDAIVDNYFIILENMEEQIEGVEKAFLSHQSNHILEHIHHLKKEMIILRKAVWPLRDVLSTLAREGSSLIQSTTQMYVRDIYDHAIQVIEVIESFRDIISEMLEVHLSTLSNRMNSIVKVLTMITTVFMPLSFIAGVYGMNFRHMPELEWRWGYPVVLGAMLFAGACMFIFFKKKKWV